MPPPRGVGGSTGLLAGHKGAPGQSGQRGGAQQAAPRPSGHALGQGSALTPQAGARSKARCEGNRPSNPAGGALPPV